MDEKNDVSVVKKFLRELSKLSEKYGVTIGGCGCCGSPYLIVKNATPGVDYDQLTRGATPLRLHQRNKKRLSP